MGHLYLALELLSFINVAFYEISGSFACPDSYRLKLATVIGAWKNDLIVSTNVTW